MCVCVCVDQAVNCEPVTQIDWKSIGFEEFCYFIAQKSTRDKHCTANFRRNSALVLGIHFRTQNAHRPNSQNLVSKIALEFKLLTEPLTLPPEMKIFRIKLTSKFRVPQLPPPPLPVHPFPCPPVKELFAGCIYHSLWMLSGCWT